MDPVDLFDVGTPEEVITVPNIQEVYGVHSRIIPDEGSPHVILEDEELGSCPPMRDGSLCNRR